MCVKIKAKTDQKHMQNSHWAFIMPKENNSILGLVFFKLIKLVNNKKLTFCWTKCEMND